MDEEDLGSNTSIKLNVIPEDEAEDADESKITIPTRSKNMVIVGEEMEDKPIPKKKRH